LQLAHDLNTGQYTHGTYHQFMVNDSKKRMIAVAGIRDRVVHRLLYEYLVPIFDKTFVYDVWSCRPNKGLIGGIERAQQHMWSYRDGWVWRSDVRKFFDSVDRETLRRLIIRRVKGDIAIHLVNEIINSYSLIKHTGMPIGNLTSQIFANIYLNELDRFVVHTVRPLGYVRYGDDIVLWLSDSQTAQQASRKVVSFLTNELGLTINPASTALQPTRHKLRYLGLELWPNGRRLNARMRSRIKQRLNLDTYESYGAVVRHHGTKRDLRRLRQDMFDNLKLSIDP